MSSHIDTPHFVVARYGKWNSLPPPPPPHKMAVTQNYVCMIFISLSTSESPCGGGGGMVGVDVWIAVWGCVGVVGVGVG